MSQPPVTLNCIYDMSLSFLNESSFNEIKPLPPFEAFIAVSKSKEEMHPVCYDSFNYINCLLDIDDTSMDIIRKNFNTKLLIEDSYLDVMFTKNAANLFSAHLVLVIKQIRQEPLVTSGAHEQEDVIISHKKKVVNASNVLTNEAACDLFKRRIFEFIQQRIHNNKYDYFPHWLINKYSFKANHIAFSNYELENCLFGYDSVENKFRMVMTSVSTIKHIKCIEKYVLASLNEKPTPVEIEPCKVDNAQVFQQQADADGHEVVKRLFVNELEILNKFEYLGQLRQKYLDG